jgi:hypothetical protein
MIEDRDIEIQRCKGLKNSIGEPVVDATYAKEPSDLG